MRAELIDAYLSKAARLQRALDAGATGSSQLIHDTTYYINHYEQQTRSLEASELYWVSRDMAALAMDAATDVPSFTVEDLPCETGLLIFSDALPALKTPPLYLQHGPHPLSPSGLRDGFEWSGDVPVWGLWWHPADDESSRVEVLTRRRELPGGMIDDAELQPVIGLVIPRNTAMIFDQVDVMISDGHPMMDSSSLGVLALISAMSVLMRQPNLAARKPLNARTGRTPKPGRDHQNDLVTLVDLRPLRHHTSTTNPTTGRHYTHRWIVRGHWRQQPHGPNRTQRRLQYIEPYTKGPDNAPLITTEKVMTWRH